jgi:hypothetical protein
MEIEGNISLTASLRLANDGAAVETPLIMIFLDDRDLKSKTKICLNLDYAKEFAAELQAVIDYIESQYEFSEPVDGDLPVERTRVEVWQKYKDHNK